MILLYIWLYISLLTLLMVGLFCIKLWDQFREQYPKVKIPEGHWVDKIFTGCRYIVASIFPIIQLVLLYAVVVDTKKLTDNLIKDMYKEYACKTCEEKISE